MTVGSSLHSQSCDVSILDEHFQMPSNSLLDSIEFLQLPLVLIPLPIYPMWFSRCVGQDIPVLSISVNCLRIRSQSRFMLY